MAIKSLELENAGPFRFRPNAMPTVEEFKVRLEFDKDVNLFIGPNNVGKSTVLQAIRLLTEQWTEGFKTGYLKSLRFPQDANYVTVAVEWSNLSNRHLRFQSDYGRLSKIVTEIKERNREREQEIRDWPNRHPRTAFEIVSSNRVGDIQSLDTESSTEPCRFDDWDNRKREDFGYVGYATHTNDSLHNTDLLASYSEGRSGFDRDVFVTIERIVAKITYGFPMRIGIDRVLEHGNDGVVADQTMDGRVLISDLSLGTRYVLAWIIQFVTDFALQYKGDSEWRSQRGIFIIDEIDAHLHPSWQRRIIPTLKEYFPNVQIFASTHSPMMVGGLSAGQVHLLNRDNTGMVTWSRNEQDIIGWTADEIYRTFMGINDPTDERTARHAEELRLLREKESLTPEEQERMQELRRLVNQDLLAGGHINSQRERFDAIMQEYLRSRTSGLSRDGV